MKIDYVDYDDDYDDFISLDELDPKQREKLIAIWSDKSEIKHYIG
ncbi:MAG: hypothetical protein OH316_00925 [Candidatus Parvarchaeota archaeon]|nr:hypothetical protein [Candidatus Parvarchaeota archaeon]MCW1301684.1 hypothetical protein [Candidatus Parvarchaeota archaeon]